MSNNTRSADRKLLQISTMLLLIGILVTFLSGMFHPDHAKANDHPAVFLEYANSDSWTAVHLGQFTGMAILIAGLLVLYSALDLASAGWMGRLGYLSAAIALGLYAVLQAVDGVALKQVVDAWANAAEAEKAARFASAEVIRWLEWAIRSYQSFVLGLTFVLFAAAIVKATKLPKLIGCLMAISGLAYLVQGWIVGVEGFSETNGIPTLLGILSILAWSIWLLVLAWRWKDPAGVQSVQPGFAQE